MKSYVPCLSLVLVSLAPFAEAQSQSHNGVSVTGVVATSRAFGAGLVVVLSSTGELDHRADVRSGGAFEFWDVPSGHYELTVTTLYGDVIHREYVAANSMLNHISVRLPETKVERPGSGTVSAAKLRHKAPSKPRKEYEKAVEPARKNDSPSPIVHLPSSTHP